MTVKWAKDVVATWPSAGTASSTAALAGHHEALGQWLIELSAEYRHIQNVSAALIELLREMRIQVWEGFWYQELKQLSGEPAEAALGDMMRYSFDTEAADGLKRVYYVNVNNIRAEHQ